MKETQPRKPKENMYENRWNETRQEPYLEKSASTADKIPKLVALVLGTALEDIPSKGEKNVSNTTKYMLQR